MAYLTGRVRPGEPTLAEALGVAFLCGGLAIFFGVSFLLAAMVMRTIVANQPLTTIGLSTPSKASSGHS